MFLRACLGAPLIVAVLCLARTAGAQEKDADLERARALFDRAGELERQGQWPAAQTNLRAALQIRETPNLRYALGWALENDDQLLEARTEYELALRLAQRAGSEEIVNLASQRISEVDRKTPLVQVRIRGQVARGTRVLVDGRDVVIRGDAGTVPVDPGTRLVRVEREGRSPTEQSVSVSRGVLRIVEVKGDDSISVRDESGVTTDRGTALPWVLVGGGGALLVTGAILFASSSGDASTRDQKTAQWCDAVACTNGMASRTETSEAVELRRDAYDAASRGNTKQVIGGIALGVGVVSAVVGVVMLVHRARGSATTKKLRFEVDAAPLTGGGFANATFAF